MLSQENIKEYRTQYFLVHLIYSPHALNTHIVQDRKNFVEAKPIILFWFSFKSKYVKLINMQKERSCIRRIDISVV